MQDSTKWTDRGEKLFTSKIEVRLVFRIDKKTL